MEGSVFTSRGKVRRGFIEKRHVIGQAVCGDVGVSWSDKQGALNACWSSEVHVQSPCIRRRQVPYKITNHL